MTAPYYATVDPATALTEFDEIHQVGTKYVAPLAQPLVVQTPTLKLISALRDEKGAPLPNGHLKLPCGFDAFAQGVEAAVLAAALKNKDAWFRRPLEDDVIRASFKAFAKGGSLRVKWPREAPVFDAEGRLMDEDSPPAQGTRLRFMLRLSQVSFGSREFGSIWTVVQAQVAPDAPTAKCAIDPSAEIPEPDSRTVGAADDSEVHEFS